MSRVWLASVSCAALVVSGCTGSDDGTSPPTESAPVQTTSTPSPSPTPTPTPTPDEPVLQEYGVSAGHPLAVEVGEAVLADGGNAMDAAIAMAFTISVVNPHASGIGGGGSVIIAGPDMDPVFHDYREVVNQAGEVPSSGTGIPGFVAGMGFLWDEYASMPWQDLVAPAEGVAADGFEVTSYLGLRISNSDGQQALSGLDHFHTGGQLLGAGDHLVQEELAATLSRLGEEGWEDFYTGDLGASLARQVSGIDAESLAGYQLMTAEPARGEFGDYEVLSAAPPLPGVALIEMLQDAEANGIADLEAGSAEYIDALSQSWLAAEQTVFNDLGDPAFVGATDSGSVNTTHISVVDRDGLTVSMTNTILSYWGSGQYVDGYFMNDHLTRFSAISSPMNQPEPGRRTVTWSNPTMVVELYDPHPGADPIARPVLAIGSPGGHQILNILGTVLVQWGLQDIDLAQAVESPRFRADGGTLFLEETHSSEVISGLQQSGWNITVWQNARPAFGSVQALEIDYESGTVSGADDPRRDGAHVIGGD